MRSKVAIMIEYNDIPKYFDKADKDQRSTVILSKYQSQLYRRLTQNQLKPLCGLGRFFDMIFYAFIVACVLIFARNLLLLSYFCRHNDSDVNSTEFRNLSNGKVAVTFNPDAEPMMWGA
jgi:hypothetical protein